MSPPVVRAWATGGDASGLFLHLLPRFPLPVQTTIGGDVYVHGRQDELSIPAFWAFFSQF